MVRVLKKPTKLQAEDRIKKQEQHDRLRKVHNIPVDVPTNEFFKADFMAKRKRVDFLTVVSLLKIGCNQAEICSIIDLHKDTFLKLIREMGYPSFSALKDRFTPKINVRIRQALIEKGCDFKDASTLKFLAKNYLGMSEDPRQVEEGDQRPTLFDEAYKSLSTSPVFPLDLSYDNAQQPQEENNIDETPLSSLESQVMNEVLGDSPINESLMPTTSEAPLKFSDQTGQPTYASGASGFTVDENGNVVFRKSSALPPSNNGGGIDNTEPASGFSR